MPLRVMPNSSKHPALAKHSSTLWFIERAGNERRHCERAVKLPSRSRAAMSGSMAAKPTPLIAASPNLIPPSSTVKKGIEALTPGGRISIPICRLRARYWLSLSVFATSEVSMAAMKWAGWCALRYAVRYATWA